MHLLLVKDHRHHFDAGTDFLYCPYSYLVWRHADQKLPSGYLCATVEGGIGNWTITPFANRRYIKHIDLLPGIREWLDSQSGTVHQPEGLDVHHQSDYREILGSVRGHVALKERYERMNQFMYGRFGIPLWRPAYDEPFGDAGIRLVMRELRRHFIRDLLKLQAA